MCTHALDAKPSQLVRVKSDIITLDYHSGDVFKSGDLAESDTLVQMLDNFRRSSQVVC